MNVPTYQSSMQDFSPCFPSPFENGLKEFPNYFSDLIFRVRLCHSSAFDHHPVPVHVEATLAPGWEQDLARVIEKQAKGDQARSGYHCCICCLLGTYSSK